MDGITMIKQLLMKRLLKEALFRVDEIASLTECPADMALAKEIREFLGEE